MTPYKAFAALAGNVYGSVDFNTTGAQPNWAAVASGLPGDPIIIFRPDPFVPLTRQLVQLDNAGQEIWRHEAGSAWLKVLDKSTVRDTLPVLAWPAGTYYNAFTALNWIAPDRAVAGRWYSLWSNYYISGNYPSYLLRSDDNGTTWAVAGHFNSGRGVGSVEASGTRVIVGANYTLFPFDMTLLSSGDAGGTWTISPTAMGFSGGFPAAILDPGDLSHAYCYGFNYFANQDLFDVDLSSGVGTAKQTSIHLTSAEQNKSGPGGGMNPDNLWIDPLDHTHQRMQAGGKLYVSHDSWATVDNATPPDLVGLNPIGTHTFTTPNDDSGPIIFGASPATGLGPVQACVSEADLTLHDRSGSGGTALPSGTLAIYGLWVGRISTHGIKVYATEVENGAGDVANVRGIPEQGDRSAFDVAHYRHEHASDLYDDAPTVHAPLPGAAGNLAVSDGSKWVSQTLTPALAGVTAEAISALSSSKTPVRVATTTGLDPHGLSGIVMTASADAALAAIDGVALAAGDRLLVKDEGSGTSLENGLYFVADLGSVSTPWVLIRTPDADDSSEVAAGTSVWVTEGSTQADSYWELTTNDPITLGTTTLTWAQLTGGGGGGPSPSATVVAETSYGQSTLAGATGEYSDGGHSHGSPPHDAIENLTVAVSTTNNVSMTKHGLAPVLPNDATKFLNGVGGYSVPPGSSAPSPSATVVSETGYGQTTLAGATGEYSDGGHSHGSPPHDAHANTTGITANDHHNQAHVLADATALGPDHTVSGLTLGFVLRALSATTAKFMQLLHSDLGSIGANDHHNQSHTQSDHTGTGAVADLTDAATAAGTGTKPAAIDHAHQRAVHVKKSSVEVATEPVINFIPGTNVTLTIVDNTGTSPRQVDVTINGPASGVLMPAATQKGQTLYSTDAATFAAGQPLIGEGGWLVDDNSGVLLVVDTP